ncbi:MAG: DUF2785 domain-containing protein [Nocardioidaceae bacterium]
MVEEYWQRIIESRFVVPSDRPLPELTAELVEMLGAVDPERRDRVAFSVLASWIEAGVYDDLLTTLGDSVCRGLTVGIGTVDDDTVFRRSFSALILAGCIERDTVAHLLPVDVVMRWAESALTWFSRERDDRGWVDGAGWAHTVAHGADLILALGESPHLEVTHLQVLLEVIAERVSATTAFLHAGEDDRLAYAVLTIVQRNLLGSEPLEAWVATLGALSEQTRMTPLGDAGWTAAAQNAKQLLRTLYAHVSIGILPRHASLDFSAAPSARPDLLLALAAAAPRASPWLYPSVTSAS